MSVDDILAEVDRLDCDLVELTGGEPLLQQDVYPLMEQLLAAAGRSCSRPVATCGLDEVPPAVVTIVDVKCPGSGEADTTDWYNLDRLYAHDEVKFVIRIVPTSTTRVTCCVAISLQRKVVRCCFRRCGVLWCWCVVRCQVLGAECGARC